MSSGPNVESTGGASNRHRPSEEDPGQRADADAPADSVTSGRRAFVALAVAVVGTVAFAFGLRTALVKLPPERAARARATGPDTASARRFTPPAQNQPDEYPRLR